MGDLDFGQSLMTTMEVDETLNGNNTTYTYSNKASFIYIGGGVGYRFLRF